jgi:hypothetical protein
MGGDMREIYYGTAICPYSTCEIIVIVEIVASVVRQFKYACNIIPMSTSTLFNSN